MSELKLVCGKCGSPFPSHTDECDANIPIVSGSTQSHLRLLAKAVLETHSKHYPQAYHVGCEACRVAREVMGGLV